MIASDAGPGVAGEKRPPNGSPRGLPIMLNTIGV